jgi:hypothetical protein
MKTVRWNLKINTCEEKFRNSRRMRSIFMNGGGVLKVRVIRKCSRERQRTK